MRAEEVLRRLYEERPLIHHLTNYVTVNLVANTTLSVGALPVMAHALEEVVEMVGLASALVVNIGTLDPPFIEAALIAGNRANDQGIPVVLDPVGAGATSFRTEAAERLLSELSIAVVCGNAGEIATLAGLAAEVRGVESLGGDPREAATKAARAVGSGCASTAVVGCFSAVGGAEAETVAHALAYFGRAGEVAAKGAGGGGTFEPQLNDALARDPKGLEDTLRVKEVSG